MICGKTHWAKRSFKIRLLEMRVLPPPGKEALVWSNYCTCVFYFGTAIQQEEKQIINQCGVKKSKKKNKTMSHVACKRKTRTKESKRSLNNNMVVTHKSRIHFVGMTFKATIEYVIATTKKAKLIRVNFSVT